VSATRVGTWKKTSFSLALGVLVYASAWILLPGLAHLLGGEPPPVLVESLPPGPHGANMWLVHVPAALAVGALNLFCSIFSGRALRHAVNAARKESAERVLELEEKNGVLSKLGRDLEHALTERSHRLNEVFEGLPGELLWASRDLRCVRVNSQLAVGQGLYPRDFEGRPVGFTGRELDKHIRLALQEFFPSSKTSLQMLLNMPFAGGQQEARMVSMQKIRNGEDALVLTQSFSARSFSADMGSTPPLSSERLASLGEMVAGIAHEINNPLAIINGRVQILRTKTVSGQLTNEELLLALDKLSQTVFRVSKIITGLRSFVRPGTGEQPEDVVPARAIEDALDFCKGRFHKQNIRIVLEVTSNRLVHCVPVQLSQILLNLLNNSLHALDGCSEKWVRIEAHDVDDSVRFKVVDSGPGVPVEIAERIFEPFFTTKEMSKGTGLGLSISRGLAEANGGTLAMERGASHTSFLLTLPSVPDSGGQSQQVESEVVPDDLPG
jgi:signal transduction histidine kinase